MLGQMRKESATKVYLAAPIAKSAEVRGPRASVEMQPVGDNRALWLASKVLPHEPALRAWLQTRRAVGLEIDDVVQETYARLIAIGSVDHVRNPKTYAFQTAHSVLMTHVRRAKIASISLVADLERLGVAADEPSPEHQIVDRDELSRVAQAIAALPPKMRAVFELRRVHGLSQRQVAERLGIAESTVEKHMVQGFLRMADFHGRGPPAAASEPHGPPPRLSVADFAALEPSPPAHRRAKAAASATFRLGT
jgi:RNA polymerase sigma factor (sigma-70 family)